MKGISKMAAIKIMVSFLIVVVLFHFFIMLQIVPYNIVWGGRLKSVEEMYAFETVSIFINILLVGLLLWKGKLIRKGTSNKVLNAILWILLVLFALNTVGNLLAETILEKLVFTPLTLLFSILIWIIVRKEKGRNITKD